MKAIPILDLNTVSEPEFEDNGFWVPGSIDNDNIPDDQKTRKANLSGIAKDAKDYTDTRLDQSALYDVSIDNDSSTKRLRLNETTKNLSTGATATTRTNIPNATASLDGAMPKEKFQQVDTNTTNISANAANISANTADIKSLKGLGRVAAHLGASPTQQQLTAAWTAVKISPVPDGATVVNLDQDSPAGHAWTYLQTGGTSQSPVYSWVDRGTDVVSPDMLTFLDFELAKQTLTSVSNVPTTAANSDISLSASATLSFSDLTKLKTGYKMRMRIRNAAASAITLTLPSSGSIENDYGASTKLGAGEKIELELWCYADGKYRLRKYNRAYIMSVDQVFIQFAKE
jgi:hypothetical protein